MNVVLYANCQADGTVHFLKKTAVARAWDFRIYHNYQLILGEQDPERFLADLRECDLFLYQPTAEQPTPTGTIMATHEMLKLLPEDAHSLSFPYVYNDGFFPIVKRSGGWEIPDTLTAPNPFAKYNSGQVHYEMARRVLNCVAEQSRREATCDVRLVPFILSRFQHERLFLTENHPTSAIYLELCRQLMRKLHFHLVAALERADYPENDANTPGGAYPIHPAAIRELGLKYPATEAAHDFYANLLHQYVQEQKKP